MAVLKVSSMVARTAVTMAGWTAAAWAVVRAGKWAVVRAATMVSDLAAIAAG